MKDKTFQGLIDTGADISVISNQFWPPEWPQHLSQVLEEFLNHKSVYGLLNVMDQKDR